ncbi:hypothetical protein G6L37_01470 [Agrobacterium rubi]|nr:hypothetical protein [Agrobacterium rubi]NTF24062.1 hypothetical protein [Agrobacterium rubi]
MPKTSVHEAKRDEVLRLRIDGRLGAAEIQRRTGVPKSVLHHWLKPYPLTAQEKSAILSAAPRYRTPKKVLPSEGEACDMVEGLSTLGRGSVAENFVKYDVGRHGLRIMNPDGDGDVVDIYVRRPGGQKVAFIQVRMTSMPPARNGLPTISLRRYRNGKANNFKKGDFHFIVGFCPKNSECYVYSYDEVSHLRNSVTITDDAAGAWSKVLDWLDGKTGEAAPVRRKRAAVASSPRKNPKSVRRKAA